MPDIRPLAERDLPQARRIFQLAFGTFLGAPDPENFWTDRDLVVGRFGAEHTAAFAAEHDFALAGSNFATRWGSVGFFGPVSIRPDLWDSGIGQRLVAAALDQFEAWGIRHAGLFTFPHSAKHVGLYGKFGFYPRFLTAVLSKAISGAAARTLRLYSALEEDERARWLDRQRDVADTLFAGLDLAGEIRATEANRLGDTVFLGDGDRLSGFAVCHAGKRTEAGSDACYVKFGAVRCGASARSDFDELLDACEALGAARGATRLVAGVNLAREQAYRALLGRGFRSALVGVAMQSGNEAAFNRPEVLALDDWR